MFPEHLLCPQQRLDAGSSREDKVLLPCNLHRVAGVMENSLEQGRGGNKQGDVKEGGWGCSLLFHLVLF